MSWDEIDVTTAGNKAQEHLALYPDRTHGPESAIRPAKIKAAALIDRIAPMIGVEPHCIQRLVIDCHCREAVKIYVTFIGDERLLDITGPDLENAVVISSKDMPNEP